IAGIRVLGTEAIRLPDHQSSRLRSEEGIGLLREDHRRGSAEEKDGKTLHAFIIRCLNGKLNHKYSKGNRKNGDARRPQRCAKPARVGEPKPRQTNQLRRPLQTREAQYARVGPAGNATSAGTPPARSATGASRAVWCCVGSPWPVGGPFGGNGWRVPAAPG